MKKRIISFIVAVATVLSVICITTGAASSDIFTEKNIRHAENMVRAMRDFEAEYSFGGEKITEKDFESITSIIDYSYPDIYILTGGEGYRYYADTATGEKLISRAVFDYKVDRKTYENIVNNVIEPWVENVVSLTNPSFSDLEYALFFHDYLCTNYMYDDSDKIHSLHEFITTGTGVCQSYMYAYMTLLNRVGVEATWACSEDMYHGWNQVKIDGMWYNVDVTWDDTQSGIPGTASHNYFLKSDTAFKSDKYPHYNWDSANECSSRKYDNNNFRGTLSPFAYLNKKWYYVADGDIYVTDSPDVAGTKIRDFNFEWFVWGSTTTVYNNKFSTLLSYEGRLYMNTPTNIIRIDPSVSGYETIADLNGDGGYIYGMTVDLGGDGVSGTAFRGGRIIVAVTKSPQQAGELITYKLPAYYKAGMGDVTGDGKLNLKDVSLLLKYIAKWNVNVDKTRADFDENGKINVNDVSKMMKRIAGWY